MIIIGASMSAPAPSAEKVSGLTYGTLTADDRREIRASWNKTDVLATLFVLGLVAGFYLYFSFWLG